MDIKEFKKNIFEEAKNYNIDEFELFYQKSSNLKINIFKGDVEKFQNNSFGGVSFRGIVDGKMGYAYSENIDKNSINFILDSIVQNSQIIDEDEKEYIYLGNENYPKVDTFSIISNNYDTNYKINLGKSIEKKAYEYDKRIVNVTSCFVGNGENEVYIANSKGLELFEKSNYAVIYIGVVAEENGIKKTGSAFWQGKDFMLADCEKIVKNACKKAIELIGGERADKGCMNVIFKNEAFADILATFIGSFFAENAQKGFSLLKGKVGEKIASECLSIKDLPLLENGFASCSFDSEGVASFDKTVVENGIFKTFLYNLKSAKKDGVLSTGNGFKPNFKSAVSTSATNFVVENGQVDFQGLVAEVENGVVVTSLAGLHSGADTVSGNFSLAASGFLIRSGKIVKPLEQMTVSGNFYEMLKNIEKIGNDRYFDMESGQGAVVCPSVLVANIDVAS